MSRPEVQRVHSGYRGESMGLAIALPARTTKTKANGAGGFPRSLKLLVACLVLTAVWYRLARPDGFEIRELFLLPICFILLRTFIYAKPRRSAEKPITDTSQDATEEDARPRQRIVLGEQCTREVSREGSGVRAQFPFAYAEQAELVVRGERRVRVSLCFAGGEERLLFEDVEPSEREEIEPLLREEIDRMNALLIKTAG